MMHITGSVAAVGGFVSCLGMFNVKTSWILHFQIYLWFLGGRLMLRRWCVSHFESKGNPGWKCK